MSSDSKWKFWGSPPKPFQKGSSLFYLGSDVGNYLRMFRNKLYDKFPKLTVEKLDEDDVSRLFVSFQACSSCLTVISSDPDEREAPQACQNRSQDPLTTRNRRALRDRRKEVLLLDTEYRSSQAVYQAESRQEKGEKSREK